MSSRQQIITGLIVIITVILCNGAKNNRRVVYFIANEIDFNPKYLQEFSPWAALIIIYQNIKTNTNRTVFHYDINACNAIGKQGSQTNNFVFSFINNFWKLGDLPRSCPVKKGNYTWKKFRAEKLSIPNFASTGRYQIKVKTYFRHEDHKDSMANLTVLVELKLKKN